MSKNKDLISFTLSKISTEQFAIVSDPPKSDETIDINTAFKFGCDKEHKAVAVFLKINFNDGSSPFLLIEAGCHFIIEDTSWSHIFDQTKNSLVLPKGFASHLLMICMGTARGILHTKTLNTPLNKYFLPLINVSEMISSDIELCIP